jgi:hypothetical protein
VLVLGFQERLRGSPEVRLLLVELLQQVAQPVHHPLPPQVLRLRDAALRVRQHLATGKVPHAFFLWRGKKKGKSLLVATYLYTGARSVLFLNDCVTMSRCSMCA